MTSSGPIKLLLDFTYLMPIIGVEVEGVERTLITLKKLREGKAKYYYTPFNILEILGKLYKLKYDLNRVAAGLHAIEEEFKLACQSAGDCVKALDLRSRGRRDIIDLPLYATSLA